MTTNPDPSSRGALLRQAVAMLLGALTTGQVLAAAPPGRALGEAAVWLVPLGGISAAVFAAGVVLAPRAPRVAAALCCAWLIAIALALVSLQGAGAQPGSLPLALLVLSVVAALLAALSVGPRPPAVDPTSAPQNQPVRALPKARSRAFIRLHAVRIVFGVLLLAAPLGVVVARSHGLGPAQAVFSATVVLFLWLLAISFFLAWPMLAEEADRLHLETRIEAEASRIRRRHARRRASRLSGHGSAPPPSG